MCNLNFEKNMELCAFCLSIVFRICYNEGVGVVVVHFAATRRKERSNTSGFELELEKRNSLMMKKRNVLGHIAR